MLGVPEAEASVSPPSPFGHPPPVRGIALQSRAPGADTLAAMAPRTDTHDRRDDEPRDDRPAPAYPLSARKAAAARHRDLTQAILRARAA
jgi:hypothetical protein